MIQLILTDMDGTFLNNRGDFNREIFRNGWKRSCFCSCYWETMWTSRRIIW